MNSFMDMMRNVFNVFNVFIVFNVSAISRLANVDSTLSSSMKIRISGACFSPGT